VSGNGDNSLKTHSFLVLVGAMSKSLSTLATIVADFGENLSPKTATVAENCDCRRIRWQSPFSVTVWTGL